jgi:hypothetical protein
MSQRDAEIIGQHKAGHYQMSSSVKGDIRRTVNLGCHSSVSDKLANHP